MKKSNVPWIIIGVIGAIGFICLCMWGFPTYGVWQQKMSGKAELTKAEQNRQILIKEADARYEAALKDAKTEVARAQGMADAMDIENGKLTSTYNQYLFIRTLATLAEQGTIPTIIYLPSEGMLPVMDLKNPPTPEVNKKNSPNQ
ncbi:MAG: hypothetical protein LBI53_05850 [Candidatus Peribacteria bacterium]|jgi:hypothetical protein|nr:hypothetical protein [Candidatus Peribacteria bacterium]